MTGERAPFSLEALTLEAPPEVDRLSAFDPRARLLCALGFALLISSLRSPAALACASLLPLALLPGGAMRPLLRDLLRLNAATAVILLFTTLTWPGERVGFLSPEGLRMGLLTAVRLNLISLLLLRLVLAMGLEKNDAALSRLGVPEVFRALLLLTLRGIFLLRERTEAALTAARLRLPGLRGLTRLRVFANILASSLLQSADHADRVMMALRCRGGLAGFAQTPPMRWRRRDALFALLFILNAAAALAVEWRC